MPDFKIGEKVKYIGNTKDFLRGIIFEVTHFDPFKMKVSICNKNVGTNFVVDADELWQETPTKFDPVYKKEETKCYHDFQDVIGIHGRSLGRSCRNCDAKEEDTKESTKISVKAEDLLYKHLAELGKKLDDAIIESAITGTGYVQLDVDDFSDDWDLPY